MCSWVSGPGAPQKMQREGGSLLEGSGVGSGRAMTESRNQEPSEQRRDELLRRLLKTPPQPRPKRERGKSDSKPSGDKKPKASDDAK